MSTTKELSYSVLKIYNNIVNSNYNYEIRKDPHAKHSNVTLNA